MNQYVVLDIETTGTHPLRSDIIEIGAVYVDNNEVKKTFNELICPNDEITSYITSITGITNEMVKDKRKIEEVLPEFIEFCQEVPLVGHNIILFDYPMLKAKAEKLKMTFEREVLDTLVISRKMLEDLPSRRLGDLCLYYNISLEHAHRAYDDAFATYNLYEKLKNDFYHIDAGLFKPRAVKYELPKITPLTTKQKNYVLKLCKWHNLGEIEGLDELTKSEASRLIDKIISQYGRM